MYIEPSIDFNSFLEDYHNGLSAKNIKEKYCLSARQYRRLCDENKLTRDYTFLKKNPHFQKRAKYYSKIGNKYVIRKVFGNDTVTYGSYYFEEVAEYVVKKLKEVRWDKKCLKGIIELMKKEEWYMNLYNQKLHSIKTTIEAEKMKNSPDYKRIKRLEKELRILLKEADIDGN